MGGSVLLEVPSMLMNDNNLCHSLVLQELILWLGLTPAIRASSQWVAPQHQNSSLFSSPEVHCQYPDDVMGIVYSLKYTYSFFI